MAKYLIGASYTSQGTNGVLTDGGSGRRAAVEKAFQGVGGKVEAIYFAFGDTDVVLIADVPDNVTALAVSLAVNASGMVSAKTTPLMTIEEVDAACKKAVQAGKSYRAPGTTK